MRTSLLWLAAAALSFGQAPSEDEQKQILAKVAANALSYANNLPDLVCSQITRRSIDPSGTGQQWRLVDSNEEELSYIGRQETYRAVSSGKKHSNPARRPAEPSSWGEFANVLSWIFDPQAEASLKWQSSADLDQRKTNLFSYAVMEPKSRFMIGVKSPVKAAFFGFVWADVETSMALHVTAAVQSPAGHALQNVALDLSFEAAKVGDKEFVLPKKSDYRAKEGKTLTWDEIEFRRYRKAGAEPAEKFEPRKR